MMPYKQFEVYLADLNPTFGTESGKTRPVLVVQSNMLNNVHPSTIICPITSNIKSGVNILRINMEEGDGGLLQASSIMIDQIRAIDNKRFIKRIGTLPPSLEARVSENIKIVLELK